jgi:hypothetical protein
MIYLGRGHFVEKLHGKRSERERERERSRVSHARLRTIGGNAEDGRSLFQYFQYFGCPAARQAERRIELLH